MCDREDDPPEPLSLSLLSVDSGEMRRLTSPPEDSSIAGASPAFSPDGRTLAFIRFSTGIGSDLYLLDLGDDLTPKGEPRQRTFMENVITSPVFTSDGRDIVFSYGTVGNPSLWRVPASGSTSPERLPFIGERGYFPAISRQGNRAAYVETSDLNDVNIWRVNLPIAEGAGGAAVKLIASSRFDQWQQYAPDGNSIAFASNRSGSTEIWKCSADGSNAVQLTSFGASATFCPRWAPDGKSIAFASDREGQWDIYVINTDGAAPRRLTSDPSGDVQPTWSRDGKWLYFAKNRPGDQQVWKMPAAGGEAVQLTKNGGRLPEESPDGKRLYYVRGKKGLWSVPVQGGEESQVLESLHSGQYDVVEDGIYFIPKSTPEAGYSIQFLRFATGAVERIFTIERPDVGLSVSPDGRSILYSQAEERQSEIMLVENFR